jgi:decaprenyl-phosphate phosphoribosyltransferase
MKTGLDTWKAHLEICRIDHWVKNVFVLPGVLVALEFASPQPGLVARLLIGLLAIGFTASSNYVINEVLDAPFDRTHPKKRLRPVPSGRVSLLFAFVQWLALIAAGLALASCISLPFAATLAVLWMMGCLYNIPPVRTKDVPYLDVLSESVNNPLRMLAGWYIVNPPYFPSTNLLLSYWMIGAYLMALKRFAEFREIGNHSVVAGYRKSFRYYTEPRLLVSVMFYASASMLFAGAFIIRYKMELILAFPLMAWVMAEYMRLAFEPESAVQAPEKLYKEPKLMFSVLLCTLVMATLLFIKLPFLAAFFTPTMPQLQ